MNLGNLISSNDCVRIIVHSLPNFLGTELSDMAACGLPIISTDAAEKPFKMFATNECRRFASALSWSWKSQEGTLLSSKYAVPGN